MHIRFQSKKHLIEAVNEYENGADPVTVDKEMVKWGMPMGPFRLMDRDWETDMHLND